MDGGSDRSAAGSRFATLPLVVVVGILYGLAEYARQRWIAPSPPGLPGDDGGDPVAYLALGVVAFGVPALLAFAVTRGRRWTPWLAWTVSILPTAMLVIGRVAELRRLPWALDDDRSVSWWPVAGVALVLAAAVGIVFSMVQRRWRIGWMPVAAGAVGLLAAIVLLPLRLGVPTPAWPAPEDGDTRPNVVLLTIDTLRADAVTHVTGAWPAGAIDRQVVSNTWVNSSWTRPAMASFFSGVVPTGHGADEARAPSTDVAWFVEDLRDAGYRTLAVVSNPHLRRRFGFDRGFDLYEHDGELEELAPIARSFWAEWWIGLRGSEKVRATADRLVPRAESMVVDHGGRGPWLLWVHLVDPHVPYHLRGPDGTPVERDPGAWIEPLRPDMEGDLFRALWPAREGTAVTTPEARAALRRLYQTEVDFALHWSERLLRTAGRASGDRDLLWLLTSDHGEEFWDEGGFEHGHTLHRSVTEVPLWIGGTKRIDGANAPRRLVDVGPWLIRQIGVPSMQPRPGTGLLEEDVDLTPFALGRPVATPAWLAEGMLYGPARTRVRWTDGAVAERLDDRRTVQLWPAGGDSIALAERAASLFIQLDLWRDRNATQGRAVDLSPDLVEQLRALGYVQ